MNSLVGLVWALVVVGFVIALPLTAVLCRWGRRVGALDSPGAAGHTKELRAVPNVGGFAIVEGVSLPLFAALIGLRVVPEATLSSWLHSVEPFLERILVGEDGRASSWTAALGLLIGVLVLHIMGLIDDRRPLGAIPKLLIQTAVATGVVIFCDVRLLELLGTPASILITIAWIIVITNAMNFLDNMDGLAGGVGVIAAGMFLAATVINQQWFIAAILSLMIGSMLGFLVFNLPPARIFMGDGGSLVIGFLLAVLTARTTFYHPELGGGWYGVFMPLIVLAIPLYDFTSVTVIRLLQGRSPFVGDQQHFSHRLVERGLSRRGAVLLIWCFTAVTGIGGISLGHLQPWQAVLVVIQTGLVLFSLAMLEQASRNKKPEAPGRT